MATDIACNVYLGAGQFSVNAGGSNEFFALQKYDNLLSKKIWETDGPTRSAAPNVVLPPENILSVAVDPAGAVYAAGGTNFSLYNDPLPTNCDSTHLPVVYCAGWFAAYNASNGTLLSHSPQEFGDVETGLGPGFNYGGLAVDLCGNLHVAGSTVGAVVTGGETDYSLDAFELDFAPTAYFPARASTSITSLTAVPNPVPHGSPLTLTATIMSGGSPVKSGSVTFVSDGFPNGGYRILNPTPAPVNSSGAATYTDPGTLPVGSHNISAVYTGTSSLSTTTSTITVTVQ